MATKLGDGTASYAGVGGADGTARQVVDKTRCAAGPCQCGRRRQRREQPSAGRTGRDPTCVDTTDVMMTANRRVAGAPGFLSMVGCRFVKPLIC
ncbi:hypothetical protein SAMN05216551_10686 [Chitinasiproducens palmae]|uniref:Uncharacterized protein n=1 Tax=Chitinasiproducens palmae TaxID=1770053 RepID=A0A1H2PPX2_9BURK|nr:hypothetical protein SAMN05216551_10686 [Chitinasiproducens palmae]